MFDKLLIYAVIILLVFGGITGVTMYTTIQKQKNDILTLEIERDNLKAAVQVKQLELDNSKEAQKSLTNIIKQEQEAADRLEKELEVIKNEPESDNGTVAPILGNAIGRLHND